MQSANYQSTATVLAVAETDLDHASPAADIQHVSIQQQILLGSQILTATVKRLQQQQILFEPNELSQNYLKNLFSVTPEAGTNLLHLSANGPKPKLLQLAVNAWIESYLQTRETLIAKNAEKVSNDLDKRLERIGQQLSEKRNEIDRFRFDHNILSNVSSDNAPHANLQGLNQSLNKAREAEVKAKAKLDTLLEALSRNEIVVPEADSQTMAVLQQQAEKLRDQLSALNAKYTEEYIDFHPSLRRTREQLIEIESKISDKANAGKNYVLQEAENNYAAARQTVLATTEQLESQKQLSNDYTSKFAEFESMQQALHKLEALQQDIKQRIVEIMVEQRQSYPQVNVVDWASLPDKPISPNYFKESLLAFLICVVTALLSVMIFDYLNRDPLPQTSVILENMHLYHQEAVLNITEHQPQLIVDHLKALPVDELPREMTYQEVHTLYLAAEPVIKGIIKLLFNGLSLSEILSLTDDCFNIETQTILIPDQRHLLMTESVVQWLVKENRLTVWPSESEVKTLLYCAAIDGGLKQPEQINIEALRFTYMLFLLRQGIRLADLTKIFGFLSPSQLGVGASFKGENAPMNEIMLDYFQTAESF